jgi:hypothetical protein
MFRKLDVLRTTLTIKIDGVPVAAEAGETVAAVFVRQSALWTRETGISRTRRAPFCMMGVCFDCLAEVDGVGSVQTCLTPVSEGMRIVRQLGKRRLPS